MRKKQIFKIKEIHRPGTNPEPMMRLIETLEAAKEIALRGRYYTATTLQIEDKHGNVHATRRGGGEWVDYPVEG